MKQLVYPIISLILILFLNFYTEDIINYLDFYFLNELQNILDSFFQTLLWFSGAWFINRLIKVFIWERLTTSTITIPKLLKDLVTTIIFFIALIFIISVVFEQPVTGIWATSGVIGIILGFAIQSIILDAFTGTAINIDTPYKIGDWIRVHGNRSSRIDIYGCVVEISWRSTRVKTRENNQVIIPNRRLGELMVTNYMAPSLPSRLSLTFTLDYSIPPERAICVLSVATKSVLGEAGLLEEPEPKIMVHNFNTRASGIEYLVWFWMKGDATPEAARHIVARSIVEHLQQAKFLTESPTRHLEDSIESRIEILNKISLFSPLNSQELNQLAIHLQLTSYKEGEMIIKEGEAGNTMFIIAEGMLNVFNNVDDINVHKLKVAQFFGGQYFGEISLFTGKGRTSTVIAATDAMLYEISKDNISPLLKEKPELVEEFSKSVVKRRLNLSQALESLVKKEEQNEQTEETLATHILSTIKSYFKI